MKTYRHINNPTEDQLKDKQEQGFEFFSEENVPVVLQDWYGDRRYKDDYRIIWSVTFVKEEKE